MLLLTLLFACFAAVLAKAQEDFGTTRAYFGYLPIALLLTLVALAVFNFTDGTNGEVQYCQTHPYLVVRPLLLASLSPPPTPCSALTD